MQAVQQKPEQGRAQRAALLDAAARLGADAAPAANPDGVLRKRVQRLHRLQYLPMHARAPQRLPDAARHAVLGALEIQEAAEERLLL